MPRNEFVPQPDEEVLYSLRTHPKYLVPYAFILLAMTVLGILYAVLYGKNGDFNFLDITVIVIIAIVALWYGVKPIWKWWAQTFTITNKQIIVGTGVIFRNSTTTQLARISSVNTQRGLLDRIFRCGTLILYTSAGTIKGSDRDETRMVLKDIPRVLEIQNKITELVYR